MWGIDYNLKNASLREQSVEIFTGDIPESIRNDNDINKHYLGIIENAECA